MASHELDTCLSHLTEGLHCAQSNFVKIYTNLRRALYDDKYVFRGEAEALLNAAATITTTTTSGASPQRWSVAEVLRATAADLITAVEAQTAVMNAAGHLFVSRMAGSIVFGTLPTIRLGLCEVFKTALESSSGEMRQPATEDMLDLQHGAALVGRSSAHLSAWAVLCDLGTAASTSATSALASVASPSLVTCSVPTTTTAKPRRLHLHDEPLFCPQYRSSSDVSSDYLLPQSGVAPLASAWADMLITPVLDDIHCEESPVETVVAPSRVELPPWQHADPSASRLSRAEKLRGGEVEVTCPPLSEEHKRLVDQSATLRDMVGRLCSSTFNIVYLQIRIHSRSIGECGPLMWVAAVDAALPTTDVAAEELRQGKVWEEERSDTQLNRATDVLHWVELARSEPCARSGTAKQRAIACCAMVLLPVAMEYYRSLNRDDSCDVEADVVGYAVATLPDGRRRLRTCMFELDGTSYVEQAFRLLQGGEGVQGGPLTWTVEEDRHGESRYNIYGRPDSFRVCIRHGDGSVLADTRSSRTAAFLEAASAMSNRGGASPSSSSSATTAARVAPLLVPTVHEALLMAAERLHVLDDLLLLKKSFDRVQLPVLNEAREYVINLVTLLFGATSGGGGGGGAPKDVVDVLDRQLNGSWCTTVRIAISENPLCSTEEVHYVTLESVSGPTKRLSRNDAFLHLGKSNFAPEVLRMLTYGPVVQKGHAETILLADAVYVTQAEGSAVCASSVTHLPATQGRRTSASNVGAVGESEAATERRLSANERFIAESIVAAVPQASAEVETWLRQLYPAVRYEVLWDAAVVGRFRATLPTGVFCFGSFVCSAPTMPVGLAHETPISGPGPLSALYKAARQVKDSMDRVPAEQRMRLKEAKGL
ncbi:hypothetical protein NESM_000056500 [Novymonas esmeraldas]|uniref:Uncharacterized protein n=1 Tax=Novymonas esmeraldas TaxID=1808958 RepID=A0AAW0F4C4_9TRYP